MKTERCEDPKCKGYNQPLVDKGYGFLVCITTPEILNPEHKKQLVG